MTSNPTSAAAILSHGDEPLNAAIPAAHPSSPTAGGSRRRPESSKADMVLKKLRLARGVTVAQVTEATGWQSHSVRGFFSSVVRKKLGLTLVSEVGKDGQRRYRVVDGASEAG